MNNFFIHNLAFRLMSPVVQGFLVYLLILLSNNNVANLGESFFNEELYICIVIAFMIQEISRLGLRYFDFEWESHRFVGKLLLMTLLTILISLIAVNLSLWTYYRSVLGYSPDISELWIFNLTYAILVIMNFTLYFSHYFLRKSVLEELKMEKELQIEFKEDYLRFTKGINIKLLYESLEAVIQYGADSASRAKEILSNLSIIYRYSLQGRVEEVTSLVDELEALENLVALYNALPYRTVELHIKGLNGDLIIPGSLMTVVEEIIRTTICGKNSNLNIEVGIDDDFVNVAYVPMEKLSEPLILDKFETLVRRYQTLSSEELSVIQDNGRRIIRIPKLRLYKE